MKYKQTTAVLLGIAVLFMAGRFFIDAPEADAAVSSNQTVSVAQAPVEVFVVNKAASQGSLAVAQPSCLGQVSAGDDLLFGQSVDLWRLGNCAQISVAPIPQASTIVAVDTARPAVEIAVKPSVSFSKPIALQNPGTEMPVGVTPLISFALFAFGLIVIKKNRFESLRTNTVVFIQSLTQSQLMVFRC